MPHAARTNVMPSAMCQQLWTALSRRGQQFPRQHAAGVLTNHLHNFGGEVVTSRYFHRKAVLSTLDQLGRTKTQTQGNLQKTRQTRPSSKKSFFCFFFSFLFSSKTHTHMATAAHIGYSIMHSRLGQSAVSTRRAHGSNLHAGLHTIVQLMYHSQHNTFSTNMQSRTHRVATTSAPTAIPNTPTETVVDGLAVRRRQAGYGMTAT